MTKFCLALIFLCLLFSACNFSPSTPKPPPPAPKIEWKEIVSDDGSFKVLFPGTPRQSFKEIDTPNGKVKDYQFDFVLSDVYFEVRYSKFPLEPDVNQNQLKSYYDSISNNTLKLQPMTLISERDIWLNGKLGRELVVEFRGNYNIYRFYLNGDRIFQVSTEVEISRKDDAMIQERTNRFLDSFQVMEK